MSSREPAASAMLPCVPHHELASSDEVQGSAKLPTDFFHEALCSALPQTIQEVSTLLTNLRDRQEQLFQQVLDQQKTTQKQLVAMQSAIKGNANVQDGFLSAVSNFVSASKEEDLLRKRASEVGTAEQEAKWKDKFEAVVPAERKHCEVKSESNIENSFKQSSTQASEVDRKGSALGRNLTLQRSMVFLDDEGADWSLEQLGKKLRSKEFDMMISLAILINAFIMCWECQYEGLGVGFNLEYPGRRIQAHVVWAGAEKVFVCFDWFFGIFFLLEMILKLVCWRQYYFYRVTKATSSGYFNVQDDVKTKQPCLDCLQGVQFWNLLDAVSVVAFLFNKLATAGFINPQMLRLLRLFRLGRLVRLLRFLESLDHLYVMTTAISGLKKILAWAIVLLSLMLLTCDLLLVQLLQVTYFDQITASDLTEDELQKHHLMYEHFGTCTRCMLSMFEITLGNWPPIARLLSEEVSEWFTLVCLVHKLTIGFAVVGVITGCILQETFKVAQTDDIILFRQKKMSARIMGKKMKALLEALDVSKDDRLELPEFEAINSFPEIKLWLSSLEFETDDLPRLFDLIDIDGDGFVTLNELLERMPRIQGKARSIDVLAVQKQLMDYFRKPDSAQLQKPVSAQLSRTSMSELSNR